MGQAWLGLSWACSVDRSAPDGKAMERRQQRGEVQRPAGTDSGEELGAGCGVLGGNGGWGRSQALSWPLGPPLPWCSDGRGELGPPSGLLIPWGLRGQPGPEELSCLV